MNASKATTGMILRRPTFRLGSSWCDTSVATVRGDNPSRRAASIIPTASMVSSRCILVPPLIALALVCCKNKWYTMYGMAISDSVKTHQTDFAL